MNNQRTELPPHYSCILGDVLQFVMASNRPVVVFGRLHQLTAVLELAASGMDIYKEYIRRCAPEYGTLTSRTEKTAYSSNIVTDLINRELLFIQKDGDDYFLYNMDTTEAKNKIRGKIRQAMRDFLRNTPALPEISIRQFQNEGPVLPRRDLMYVFDENQEPEIGQVLVLNNMAVSSEEGEAYDIDEVRYDNMDELAFPEFPMLH